MGRSFELSSCNGYRFEDIIDDYVEKQSVDYDFATKVYSKASVIGKLAIESKFEDVNVNLIDNWLVYNPPELRDVQDFYSDHYADWLRDAALLVENPK